MEVIFQFLYCGVYNDFENIFQCKVEMFMQVYFVSIKDVVVFCFKQWFVFDDVSFDIEFFGQILIFCLYSLVRFKNRNVFSYVEICGQVFVEFFIKEIIQVVIVDYEVGEFYGNLVIDYFQCNGFFIEQFINFENFIFFSGKIFFQLCVFVFNEIYVCVFGDYNFIYVFCVFVVYVNLFGIIIYGMYFSVVVCSLVEIWVVENKVGCVCSFYVFFIGMVFFYDDFNVKLQYVGMVVGCKIIKVEVSNKEMEEKVFFGEVEIEQFVMVYVFIG